MFIELDFYGCPISLNTDHIVAVTQWFKKKDEEKQENPLAEIHLDAPVTEFITNDSGKDKIEKHSTFKSYESYKDVVVYLENAKVS